MSSNPNAGPTTFETAFGELQHVVEQLERGGTDLETVLALVERGGELADICTRLLEAADLRVMRLTAESASPLPDAGVVP